MNRGILSHQMTDFTLQKNGLWNNKLMKGTIKNNFLLPRCRNRLVSPNGCEIDFAENPISWSVAYLFVLILKFIFTIISKIKIFDVKFLFSFFKSWWSDEFHVTKDVFKERITSILKKRINPKPNATDKIMYPIYRRFSFYFPFVAFVSIFRQKNIFFIVYD